MQTGCDLQPKVLSFPDSVGDFISARYPALLADPNVYPEIYNSAVTDYGVYASPELYGSDTTDDYVFYASVDDYIVPPQMTDADVGEEDRESWSQTYQVHSQVRDHRRPAHRGHSRRQKHPEGTASAVPDGYLQKRDQR